MNRLLAFAAILLFSATTIKAQQRADSIVIQSILNEEVSSWNKGDAVTYSRHFSDKGTFTNIRGLFYTGHQQFLDRHVEIFKGMFAKTVLNQQLVSFRFLKPDVAIVETLTWIGGFPNGGPKGIHLDAQGRIHTRLLQVFQKEGNAWKIVVYHNVDLKADTPVPAHG